MIINGSLNFSRSCRHQGLAVAGFAAFRLIDIFKPLGCRKMERFGNGWGVMLDDVLAGSYASPSPSKSRPRPRWSPLSAPQLSIAVPPAQAPDKAHTISPAPKRHRPFRVHPEQTLVYGLCLIIHRQVWSKAFWHCLQRMMIPL